MANITDLWKIAIDTEIVGADKAVKQLEKVLSKVSAGVSIDPKDIKGLKNLENALQNAFENAFKKANKKTKKRKGGGGPVVDKKSMADTFSKIAEGIESAIQRGFNALKSGDITAVGPMIKGLGKAFGKINATMGKMVMAIGSSVGMLTSAANIIMSLDKTTKGLNKTLLEGGVTVQDMGVGLGGVTKRLETARNAALDLSNNLKWGTLAKDQMEILKAFNEAGYLMSEMTEHARNGAQAMEAYQEATTSALKWSKLLGVSTTEMAGQQAKFMEEQGMGLKDINEGFNAVYKAADLAGFGTKRFYSMVINTTSGMSMYNVRMEEAASLLVSLSKALSPENAQKFLQAITAGYTETGYKDRVKKIMITGGKTVDKIMERNALLATQNFANKFEEKLPEIGEAMKEIGLGDIGITGITDPANQKKAIDKMAKMSQKEIAMITAKLKETDPSGLLSREFGKLLDQAKGTTDNLGDQAKAMGDLGPGGVLAMKLAEGNALLGPIHERGLVQLMATEELAGYSGEQLKQMQNISRDMYGSYDNLKKLQERVKNQGSLDEKGLEKLRADQQQAIESYGATVDNTGKMVTTIDELGNSVDKDGKNLGREIKDMTDFTMSQAEKFSGLERQAVDENTLLAREIAQNTTDLATLIEMGVEKWLESIYKVVFPLAQWILKKMGVSLRDPKETEKLLNSIRKEISNRGEMVTNKQAEVTEIQKKIEEESDPGMRTVLEEQLKVAQKQLKGLKFGVEGAQAKLERTTARAMGTAPVEDKGTGGRVYEKFGEQAAGQFQERGKLLRKTLSQEMENIGVTVYEEGDAADEMIRKFEQKVEKLLTEGKSLNEAMGTAQEEALAATASAMKQSARMEQNDFTEEDYEKMEGRKLGTNMTEEVKRKVSSKRSKQGKDLLSRTKDIGFEKAKKELEQEVGKEEVKNIIGGMDDHTKKTLKDEAEKFRKRTAIEKKQKDEQAALIAKLTVKEEEKARITRAVQSLYGMGKVPENIMDQIESDPTKAIQTLKQTQKYKSMGPALQRRYPELFGLESGPTMPDFIYRPGMAPMKFSSEDTVIGAQEGGPMEKAFGRGGKDGGKHPVQMSFTINGGDPKKVYSVVRKALTDAGIV